MTPQEQKELHAMHPELAECAAATLDFSNNVRHQMKDFQQLLSKHETYETMRFILAHTVHFRD